MKPSTKRLVLKILRDLDDMDSSCCSFWACEGPDKRPESMKTCRVCWAVRDARRALKAIASEPK